METEIYFSEFIKKIQEILNTENGILRNHGEKVAFLYLQLLQEIGGYTKQQLYRLVYLAILHDIGAYKTDNIADIKKFEINAPHPHAIYGYLFFKHYFSFGEENEVILYHHFTNQDYLRFQEKINVEKEAKLLHFADRIAVLWDNGYTSLSKELISLLETTFSNEEITLFKKVEQEKHIFKKLQNESYFDEIYAFFEDLTVDKETIRKVLFMLVNTVDFKSEYTMFHTITVRSIARVLASYFPEYFGEKEIKEIADAASIHDVGKLYTPTEILEKPDKLTPEEYEVMKRHITDGRKILEGLTTQEEIMLATTHHEKLDGSGYPDGLVASQINMKQRILIVADIVSALRGKRSYKEAFTKDDIIAIIQKEADSGKIDATIVNKLVNHYDEMMDAVDQDCKETWNEYVALGKEYQSIMSALSDKKIMF